MFQILLDFMLRVRKTSHSLGCVLAGASQQQLPSLTARLPHWDQTWHLFWEAFSGTIWVFWVLKVWEDQSWGGLSLCGMVRAFAGGGLVAPGPCLKLSQALMEGE